MRDPSAMSGSPNRAELRGEASLAKLLESRFVEASAFFARAEREARAPASVGFRALFASVPRRLAAVGREEIGEAEELPLWRPHWKLTDAARLWLLLLGLDALGEGEQPGWVLALFEAGEIGEQVSILRTLAALPDPGRFVEIGEQACRHNSLDVFEAIVAENPFPAAHFALPSFNQAVMKSIFLGVSVKRIEGLASRIRPELSRMAADYASERRAAGRSVPEDATYLAILGSSAPPR